MSDQVELFRPLRYITTKKCVVRHNGVTIQFEAGRVIEDPNIIDLMRLDNSPILPIKDEDDLGTCPHCGRSFSLTAQKGARELLSRAKLVMQGF